MRAHALVVGKGIKSNQKRHETQAKPVRRRGAGGRSHYRARKKCFWREKCCVTACGSYLYRVGRPHVAVCPEAVLRRKCPLIAGCVPRPRRMRSLSALLCAPAALQGRCGCTCVAVHCSCSAPVPDDRQPRHAQGLLWGGPRGRTACMRDYVPHACPTQRLFVAPIQATCAIYRAMACSSVSESYLMAECRRE